jgi:three-Cys-motif partner protein
MEVPSEYHGREQSYLKHLVLKEYLGQWAHKLGSTAKDRGSTRLWYVDTFAGPWNQRHPELRDTSFAIGLHELEAAARTWQGRGCKVEVSAIFVEKDKCAFAELRQYLDAQNSTISTYAFQGEFGDHASKIAGMLGREPAFVFVDPLGWKGAAMRYIEPLSKQGPRDIMVNVMFDHLNRQKDRLVEHVREQMRDFFGLDASDLQPGLDEDELFKLYRTQLKLKCGLQYAADLVVPHPTMERTKFHLVVGGKSKAVLEVFREVERRVIGSAAAEIRDEAARRAEEAATGQLSLLAAPASTDHKYQLLHGRDSEYARHDIESLLATKGELEFDRIWPEILENRHLTVTDLKSVLWKMSQAKTVVVRNATARERSIKAEHVIALPKAPTAVKR